MSSSLLSTLGLCGGVYRALAGLPLRGLAGLLSLLQVLPRLHCWPQPHGLPREHDRLDFDAGAWLGGVGKHLGVNIRPLELAAPSVPLATRIQFRLDRPQPDNPVVLVPTRPHSAHPSPRLD